MRVIINTIREWEKILLVVFALFAAACSNEQTKSQKAVDQAAMRIKPSQHENTLMYGSRVFSCATDTDCQVGLLKLGDGEVVEFWFSSHHRFNDLGCTRFEFSDGTVRYLHGLFCCEVMIEDAHLDSRRTLERFIKDKDGLSP